MRVKRRNHFEEKLCKTWSQIVTQNVHIKRATNHRNEISAIPNNIRTTQEFWFWTGKPEVQEMGDVNAIKLLDRER